MTNEAELPSVAWCDDLEGAPVGLRFAREFLTPDEADELVRELAGLDWDGRGKFARRGRTVLRRELDFIRSYQRQSRKLGETEPLPDFLIPVRARCAAALGMEVEEIGQVITALYRPGAAIDWHVDSTDAFGDVIFGVSLGSTCQIEFRPTGGGDVWPLKLPPRSLFVLDGPSRYEFQHRIKKVKETRYSITLRTLRRMK